MKREFECPRCGAPEKELMPHSNLCRQCYWKALTPQMRGSSEVERVFHKHDVTGSNPVPASTPQFRAPVRTATCEVGLSHLLGGSRPIPLQFLTEKISLESAEYLLLLVNQALRLQSNEAFDASKRSPSQDRGSYPSDTGVGS